MSINAGVVGGSGYTGGEVLRLLLRHPELHLAAAQSNSAAGSRLSTVHPDLLGETELRFCEALPAGLDVLFLCLGHGHSTSFMQRMPAMEGTCIIDLSRDFRPGNEETDNFIYGLPELHGATLRAARKQKLNVANPGCFATGILLGLLPLAAAGHLQSDVHISAITGSTGAGRALTETGHFSWRSANAQVYQAFTHPHLPEIRASLRRADEHFDQALHFLPFRGAFQRGIISAIYTRSALTQKAAEDLYRDFYARHPFVHLSDANPDLKQVVNTNKCVIGITRAKEMLLITSVIDNLLKGAAGQAIQNANLMFGLPETMGLHLKAGVY